MQRIFVITGTPGVGKTTMLNGIKKRLSDCSVYDTTKIINDYKAYRGKDRFGTKIVNLGKLRRILLRMLAKDKSRIIILEGHILCEFNIPKARVIVIRSHLNTIKARLLERKYPVEKIRDNIVSEALDYCGFRSRVNYKNVYEILKGSSANTKILNVITGKGRLGTAEINLLPELKVVIKKNSRFAL